jgi:hypothetical protein
MNEFEVNPAATSFLEAFLGANKSFKILFEVSY